MTNESRQIAEREPQSGANAPTLLPPVDITETESGIELLADLPGVDRQALHIQVDGDALTIEGDIVLGEPDQMTAHYAEVRSPRFRRRFTLSRELDGAAIEANLKDGVLKLFVPRREEAKPRKIDIKIS